MNNQTAFAVLSCAFVSNGATAGFLFAEALDDASANVTINQQADTDVMFVNYGAMTIGSTNFSLPEAPRPVAGGAATRGVLMRANLSVGAAAGVNMLAGATPMAFSGNYTVSFDVYMNVPTDPLPTGSTEQLLWGVGVDNSDPIEARNTRFSGASGVWGWLAGDNGYGTEDAAIYENGVELADLGDTQPGEDIFFNNAFDMPLAGPNDAPANAWVEVDIIVAAGNVRVLFNGVEFFNEDSAFTDGFAMLGYEDPFSSIGDQLDAQWAVFDNFTVTPAPGAAAILSTGLVAWSRRRRGHRDA